MSDTPADFAVFGSTPLARLLAGLLHQVHGRSTLLVGDSHARYRLPREIDLSVGAMTRPQSWALLAASVPETTRLLGKIAGRHGWNHVDPLFFAETPRAREALGHIGHMAAAFGLSTEAVPPSLLGPGQEGVRMRDAVQLHRPVIEPALDDWLDALGVPRIVPDRVELAPDGAASLAAGDETYAARQAILADDASIIAYLPLRQWPTLLSRQPMSTILTTSTAALAARVMAHVDTGTVLVQQERGGVAAIGPGGLASAAARLRTLLPGPQPLQHAGQVLHQVLATEDGSPAFGRAAGAGADIIVGLGSVGAFIAPALSRWLAGVPTPQEAVWFGERLVGRGDTLTSVADYRPAWGSAA
ncbi:MAG: hypothetical protein KIS86_12185 [Devosia sp.]|nr:hypothetical protein [Devosia sp.]